VTVKFQVKTTWREIHELAARHKRLFHSMSTYWWIIGNSPYIRKSGQPCGPQGEILLESDDSPAGFLAMAAKNQKFYGKHGLLALQAAYHGNTIIEETGQPTSLASWDDYNRLIDESEEMTRAQAAVDDMLLEISKIKRDPNEMMRDMEEAKRRLMLQSR
jgi:hypothetical protein